jgi:hypothetical protein
MTSPGDRILVGLAAKPFVWTATVEAIMEKLSHCRQTLEKISTRMHSAAQPKEEQ